MTAPPAVTRDAVTSQVATGPALLGKRGRRLWTEVTAGAELAPTDRVLLEEACRLADRLDRLDRILRGDDAEWVRIRVPEVGDASIVVDRALAEARQQQVALKQLLVELRQSRAAAPGKPGRGGPVQPTVGGKGVAGVADLTSRIADRRAQAQG